MVVEGAFADVMQGDHRGLDKMEVVGIAGGDDGFPCAALSKAICDVQSGFTH
jgi:hypothetical protein